LINLNEEKTKFVKKPFEDVFLRLMKDVKIEILKMEPSRLFDYKIFNIKLAIN
jgi:hypothetical protein